MVAWGKGENARGFKSWTQTPGEASHFRETRVLGFRAGAGFAHGSPLTPFPYSGLYTQSSFTEDYGYKG